MSVGNATAALASGVLVGFSEPLVDNLVRELFPHQSVRLRVDGHDQVQGAGHLFQQGLKVKLTPLGVLKGYAELAFRQEILLVLVNVRERVDFK